MVADDTTTSGGGAVEHETMPADRGVASDAASEAGFGSLLEQLAAAPLRVVDRARTLGAGSKVGERYVVERELGQGGMGVVYLAHDRRLGRPVAIKLCFDSTTQSGAARISREARALAALSHPNVLEVYGVGRHDGMLYIAMEYVEGGTAGDWVRHRTRPWREVVEFYCQAAEGLALAHQHGIVHRDFKPDNVLVGPDGRPRVADFGLASPFERAGSRTPSAGATLVEESNDRLTRTGAVVGTPAYMAPEQMFALDVDGRADQFALCCALFEALLGLRPFAGKSGRARLAQITERGPQWPRRTGGVPRRIIAAIDRGLQTDADARWPTMDALVAELRAPPRGGRWLVGGALLLSGALAVVGTMDRGQIRCGPNPLWDTLWDPPRRDRVEASLAAVGVDDTAPPVIDLLDRYAEGLAEQYATVCELDDPAFDPAMACARARRDGFARLTDLFVTAEPNVGGRARSLVASLESVAACGGKAGERGGELTGAAARRVRADIDTARLEQLAGNLLAADTSSARALDGARVLDARSVLAEALLRRALVLEELGRRERAIDLLEEAYFVASSAGHREVSAQSLLGLIRTHGAVGPQGLQRAVRWHAMAVAASERLSADVLDPIAIAVEYGTALTLADRADQGREVLEAALRGLDERGEGRTALRLRTLMALGGTYQIADVSERLTPTREAALELAIEVWGPAHPKTGTALEGLAVARMRDRHPDEVESLLRRAARIYDASFGDGKGRLLAVYNKLGNHFVRIGEVDRAIEIFREAVELGAAQEDSPSDALVNIEANLGSALLAVGDVFDAVIHLERAVALAEVIHGPDALRTAGAVVNAGAAYLSLDRHRDSINAMRRALAVLDQLGSSGRRARLIARMNLATALSETGEVEAAFAVLDRAIADNPAQDRAAAIVAVRGSLYVEDGRYAEAIEEFARCNELLVEMGTRSHPGAVRCRSDLAYAELQRGEPARAAVVLEELMPLVIEPSSGARVSTVANVHLNFARAVRDVDRKRAIAALEVVLQRTTEEPSPAVQEHHDDALALLGELSPRALRRWRSREAGTTP